MNLGTSLSVVLEWEDAAPELVCEWFGELEECHITEGTQKEVALEACLEQFTAWEELGDDNAVRCSACKEFGRAWRKIDLWSVPPVLVLQLKRFEYVDDERIRLDTPVCFPLEGLDLSQVCRASDCRTFPLDRNVR